MATHFSVSDMTSDDDTLSRKTSVRVGTSGDFKFQTPLKVGLGDVTEIPFYEAHKRIKPDTIIKCLESEEKDREQGRDLKKRCKGEFNVLTLEYDSKDFVPNEKMVVAMSDMQYANTDAITTPSWFELIEKNKHVDVQQYITLSDIFLEAASTRNHKPILGTIPQNIPPGEIGKVIKFYIDHDVTSFVVDSHGRTIISGSWIRAFQRSLGEYDVEKESILYTMNAFQGTIPKTKTATEAKDFIGFTAGFDIIGGKHNIKFYGSNREVTQHVGKVFNRDTYNYEKQVCSKEEKKLFDEKVIREQNIEFKTVQEAIYEKSLKSLLTSKELTKETMNTIRSFKDRGRTMRIDDFI